MTISQDPTSTVGHRLLTLRKSHKHTQKTIAKICDVSAATVSLWEGDATTPKTLHIIALSDFYRVSVRYIALGISSDADKQQIPHRDRELLAKYHLASRKIKEAIDILLNIG